MSNRAETHRLARGALRRAGRIAPALLPLALFLATGLRGLDFGFHWDEPYHVETLIASIERGVPLPEEYRYPSVSYWLTVASALPDLARALSGRGEDGAARERLIRAVQGKAYRLRTRGVFLVVSSLSLLLTYALVLRWRQSAGEALLASAILGTSWEVAYHARWVAPDAVLMTLGAATILGAVAARLRPRRSAPLWAAALAAGFATGTKWPAGLLLLPVLIAAWQTARARPRRARLRLGLGLCAVAGGAYLVSTPGTLLDAGAVLDSLQLQQGVYGSGHLGFTASPGPAHLGRIAEYFALSVASPSPGVSLVFFAFFLAGLVALVRESRSLALLFLGFPVAYLLFFAAYPVMIARNYLVLAPFFAILSARGIHVLAGARAWRPLRVAVLVSVSALLLWNGAWLASAAESIRSSRPNHQVRELAAWLDAHPHVRYAVSPRLVEALRRLDAKERSHVVAGPLEAADAAVFWASDAYGRLVGCRPRFDLTTTWFGPREVNFNYYPSWLGRDRIVVMPVAHYPKRPVPHADKLPPNLRPGALE